MELSFVLRVLLLNLMLLALLGFPILGFIMARRLGRAPFRERVGTLGVAAGCVGLVIAAAQTRWSFKGIYADMVAIGAAGLAYCILAFACLAIPGRALRIAVVSVAVLPMILGVCVATVGLLGLVFAIGDLTNPDVRTVQVAPTYSYRSTSYGGATVSVNGTNLEIHYNPRMLPFLEHEVFSMSCDDNECLPGTITVKEITDGLHSWLVVQSGNKRLQEIDP